MGNPLFAKAVGSPAAPIQKLSGKVVFITGGIAGVGKACAIQAAKEGASVAVADLADSQHEKTMQELKKPGTETLFVPIDVASVARVKDGQRHDPPGVSLLSGK